MGFADTVSLSGRYGALVPLSQAHHDQLVEAVKDGELWKLWYTSIPTPEQMHAEIDRRLQLQCLVVEFRTHFFNRQSRAGIERLGAKLDGVLRQHQPGREGTLRDTCVYSIIDSEWPAVKLHLAYQLERPRSPR